MSSVLEFAEELLAEFDALKEREENFGPATAGELYTAYCAAVGGKAFNGDPLPSWENFSKDQSKTAQARAWVAVAFLASKGTKKQ